MVCYLPCAGISSVAAIVNGTGSTAGAELQVLRPGNMSDDAVATYLIQAFSDESGNTKVGYGRFSKTGSLNRSCDSS